MHSAIQTQIDSESKIIVSSYYKRVETSVICSLYSLLLAKPGFILKHILCFILKLFS